MSSTRYLLLLKQVVANILLNAVDAVAEQGKITVETKILEQKLQINIRDNGAGIPAEKVKNIFKPFYTTKNTGTGLGLAMAKRVIEAHSGSINLYSDHSGTLFIVQIPLK